MMEAVRTSEMSVCFNETRRRYNQKGCHFYARHRVNLKFKLLTVFSLRYGQNVKYQPIEASFGFSEWKNWLYEQE
jgi:hypothetical protein